MSGQLVDYHKFALQYTKNIDAQDYFSLQQILMMDNPLCLGKYLGYLILIDRVTKNKFGEVVEKSHK